MSTVAAVRNASVNASVKLEAFVAGRKAGKTMAEIAAGIGMRENSFGVAISKLRSQARDKKAKNPAFVNPFDVVDALPSTRASKGVNVFDNTELMNKLNAVDAEPDAETAQGETEVAAS